MRSILVASDLSERSDRAVMRALHLAERTGATCHALFIADESLPHDVAESLRQTAEKRLRRFLDAHDGQGAQVIARVGDPVETLGATASEIGAELVVLGLHRPRPFLDALRETTMERLVRLLSQPVLLVRDPADHDYAGILAGVTFSPACAAALRAARSLAPTARITSFHAIHIPFAGLTGEGRNSATARQVVREAEAVRDQWLRTENLPADLGEVTMTISGLNTALSEQLKATGADLLALGAHTRRRYVSSGLGSFAAGLIRNPPTDLLIARP